MNKLIKMTTIFSRLSSIIFKIITVLFITLSNIDYSQITVFKCMRFSKLRQPSLRSIMALSILLGLSMEGLAQNLTISSSGQTGTSGTNWSISGTTLTVTGTANIQASVLETSLANGNLYIEAGNINANANITSTTANVLRMRTSGYIEFDDNTTLSTSGGSVVLWSSSSGGNAGYIRPSNITTNGGHVWIGGSGLASGERTWNRLLVGDGPSIGAFGFNSNVKNVLDIIISNCGGFLTWSGLIELRAGISGIEKMVSVGSGDIVLITDIVCGSFGAAMFFVQSNRTFTLVPHESSFRSRLNWNPAIQTAIRGTANDYNLQAGYFHWLEIEELNSISRLTIGYYNGMLNDGTPVEFTNSSQA